LEVEQVEHKGCSYVNSLPDLIKRLKKIEGQIRGIQSMIEDHKYCVDILIQIAAARSALNKVGMIVLEEHIRGCVAEALETSAKDKKITELVDVVLKFTK